MMNTGRPKSDATRHIEIHNFFIHEKLNSGQISLTHIDTQSMLADIFTKPITGHQFSQLLLKCGMTDFPPDPPSTTSSPSNFGIIRSTEGDQVSVAYRHPALRGIHMIQLQAQVQPEYQCVRATSTILLQENIATRKLHALKRLFGYSQSKTSYEASQVVLPSNGVLPTYKIVTFILFY